MVLAQRAYLEHFPACPIPGVRGDLLHPTTDADPEAPAGIVLESDLDGRRLIHGCDKLVTNGDVSALLSQLDRPDIFIRWCPIGARPDPSRSPVLRTPDVRLHPIEVVIPSHVIEEIALAAEQVCSAEDDREVIGFLSGRIHIDRYDRAYTLVDRQHTSPELVGTSERVEKPQTVWQEKARLLANIPRGSLYVGFWHSHPRHKPFLSDALTWKDGHDVQTAQNYCANWWEAALVVDTRTVPGGCMVGAYKITDYRTDERSYPAYRSVGVGIL